MDQWTPDDVYKRLREAADTLKILPDHDRRLLAGTRTSWPDVVREANEAYGWQNPELCGSPAPAAIDRMDEALGWLRWLSEKYTRVVWARANRFQWHEIAARYYRSDKTVSRWKDRALEQIADELNARDVPVRVPRGYE